MYGIWCVSFAHLNDVWSVLLTVCTLCCALQQNFKDEPKVVVTPGEELETPEDKNDEDQPKADAQTEACADKPEVGEKATVCSVDS